MITKYQKGLLVRLLNYEISIRGLISGEFHQNKRKNMRNDSLSDLEGGGYIKSKISFFQPERTVYTLTPKGREVAMRYNNEYYSNE